MQKSILGWAGMLALMMISTSIYSQKVDTSDVLSVVEKMPVLVNCNQDTLSDKEKYDCTTQGLLNFFYKNIKYPEQAKNNGTSGTVVLRFVVEKDGTIGYEQILKDVADGCGAEALRVLKLMSGLGVKFTPGKQNGKEVRVFFNLPIKFKLAEEAEFVVNDGDSIYVKADQPLNFKTDVAGLNNYLSSALVYPRKYEDSCLVGEIDLDILVRPDNSIRILNMDDFSALGVDFRYEAILAVLKSSGQWTPAVYKNKKVAAAFQVIVPFRPKNAGCATTIANFDKASTVSQEAISFFNENKKEEAIVKLNEALKLAPRYAALYGLRGQIHYALKQNKEACEDLRMAKGMLRTTLYNDLLNLVCEPAPVPKKTETKAANPKSAAPAKSSGAGTKAPAKKAPAKKAPAKKN